MFNLFGENVVLEKLSTLGDPLERLNATINWEMFRPTLNELLSKDRSRGGRPPYDYILMFKIIILQRLNNLSDDKTEYMILDRLSFQRFLGLVEHTDKIPDAKTIWSFKNNLAQNEQSEKLFVLFEQELESQGLISHEGTLVDASFVEVPKQRNSRDENKEIKEGKIPDNWSENKKRQKDTDARWTKKGGVNYFGYKNHVAVDQKSKLIKSFKMTSANVHDSQIFDVLLSEKDKVVYADSAYVGQELSYEIKQVICERAYRNKPLTEEQKENNRKKSKIRSRVEHVFGFIENSMGGSTFKGVGKVRAKFNILITSLTYNLSRYEQIKRLKLA